MLDKSKVYYENVGSQMLKACGWNKYYPYKYYYIPSNSHVKHSLERSKPRRRRAAKGEWLFIDYIILF